METDFITLAELKPGERPYKGYRISLEKGYFRVMSSKVDPEGMVAAINYYGRTDTEGRVTELNRVTEKRQTVKEFDADLDRFRGMIEKAGLKISIEKL